MNCDVKDETRLATSSSSVWGQMPSALPFHSVSHSRPCREEASRLMVLILLEVEALQGCESVLQSDTSHVQLRERVSE